MAAETATSWPLGAVPADPSRRTHPPGPSYGADHLEPEPDQAGQGQAAERREYPALGEADTGVTADLQHSHPVREVAEGKEGAGGQEQVEEHASPTTGNHAGHQRACEEQDQPHPLGVGVEERQAGFGSVRRARSYLVVVFRRAGQAVSFAIGVDTGGGIPLDGWAELRHDGTPGFTEGDERHGHEHDAERGTTDLNRKPPRDQATEDYQRVQPLSSAIWARLRIVLPA